MTRLDRTRGLMGQRCEVVMPLPRGLWIHIDLIVARHSGGGS